MRGSEVESHGCHTVDAVAVGALWVASNPVGLNIERNSYNLEKGGE